MSTKLCGIAANFLIIWDKLPRNVVDEETFSRSSRADKKVYNNTRAQEGEKHLTTDDFPFDRIFAEHVDGVGVKGGGGCFPTPPRFVHDIGI